MAQQYLSLSIHTPQQKKNKEREKKMLQDMGGTRRQIYPLLVYSITILLVLQLYCCTFFLLSFFFLFAKLRYVLSFLNVFSLFLGLLYRSFFPFSLVFILPSLSYFFSVFLRTKCLPILPYLPYVKLHTFPTFLSLFFLSFSNTSGERMTQRRL